MNQKVYFCSKQVKYPFYWKISYSFGFSTVVGVDEAWGNGTVSFNSISFNGPEECGCLSDTIPDSSKRVRFLLSETCVISWNTKQWFKMYLHVWITQTIWINRIVYYITHINEWIAARMTPECMTSSIICLAAIFTLFLKHFFNIIMFSKGNSAGIQFSHKIGKKFFVTGVFIRYM